MSEPVRAKFLPNPHIERENCVEQCMGCAKIYSDIPLGECSLEDHVCIAYVSPKAIHRIGCFLKTNKDFVTEKEHKVNPLKASKRARRKK